MAEIINLPRITKLNLPAERVLQAALEVLEVLEAGLDGVLVLGYGREGDIYMASSYADSGDVIWLMEKCKKRLLDFEAQATNPPPNGTADVHPIK